MSGIGQGTPPGTQWLQQARRWMQRDNPEDMFTPQQNFERNKQWAKPGPYTTTLPPDQEQKFQQWLKDNKIDLSKHEPAYDMRGFWAAQQAGDERAQTSFSGVTNSMHFPDHWKTPYSAFFSNESIWATPNAPHWVPAGGDYGGGGFGKPENKDYSNYVMPDGRVIFDDVRGRWHGVPQP